MGFFARLRGTLRGPQESLQDEIEFHIEQRVDELVSGGLSRPDALSQARREFGNPSKWREETRDADIFVTFENCLRDTRQSWRGLLRRPMFAATAIGSLAIGIAALASLFAVADAVIWKPVALPGEGDLYFLQEAKRGVESGSNGPRLKDWQTLSSVTAATGWYGETLVWRAPGGNEAIRCLRTYSGMMATAKPGLLRGRAFTTQEESGEPVALVSYAFWRNRLHSESPDAIELSGKSYRIVGVLDAAVRYPDAIDLWVPAPAGLQGGTRQASYLDVLARLNPGVSLMQANAEIKTVVARLAQANPKTDRTLSATLEPLRQRISRDARNSLYALLGVAACVLAMICVNVAALLLTRGAERERESAIRSAMGARTASLVRLYLIEALLLALAGGVLGVALSVVAVDLLKQVLPSGLPRLADASVDWRVISFALGASFVTAVVSGLAPAWLASRKAVLHDGTRGAAARTSRKGLRTAFVLVEIALSVVLVTTGLRLTQAFLDLSQSPRGFRVNGVVTASVPFPWTVKEDRLHNFAREATERFSALPGVVKVGLVDQYPMLGGTQDSEIRVEGNDTGVPIRVGMRSASPEYFDVMNVRLIAGRLFSTRKPVEFVANEAFAKRYFAPGRPNDAQRFAFANSNTWHDIVGVISDLPKDPAHNSGTPELFTYYGHDYWPYLNFAMQTQTPAALLAPLIRQEVAKLDGTVIVKSVTPLEDKLSDSTRDSRVRSILVGASATLALLLMAIGVHGLIAGDVSTRWREFGVRLAMGATTGSLRMLLVQKIAALSAAGLVAGIVVILSTSNLLAHSFEGLPPVRAFTVAAVCVAIGLAALTAILWPLYRIARIDPASALRHD